MTHIKHLYKNVHSSLAITQDWKQLKYPSAGEWIDKFWYIFTMELNSTLKRDELLIHITTWMDLKNMLKGRARHKGIHAL